MRGHGRRAATHGGRSARRRSVTDRRSSPPLPKWRPGARGSAEACDMALAFDLNRPFAAIVIGRAGMDLYPLPDGTETESTEQFAAGVGGSAGNIAVALSRQGYRAALLSPLSEDSVGRFVRKHLARYAVDTSRCRVVAGEYRTSLAICETRLDDCETVFYRN